ncbi:MAG TPA: hypothetical protein VGB08_08460 [Allosphingosinicella sp.]|jgi:hypothetical protein
MNRLRTAFLLLFTGALAAAVAVIAMAALSAVTMVAVGAGGIAGTLVAALLLVPLAIMVSVSAMPALVPILAILAAAVGGALWRAGRRRSWLRRRRSWAGAGALVGAAVFGAIRAGAMPAIGEMLGETGLPDVLLLAAMALSGAVAALMFRTTINLLDAFADAGDGGAGRA